MSEIPVELAPITARDIEAVARFLCESQSDRGGVEAWAAAMAPPWPADQPNHGFLLREGDRVVGAHLAFYSERAVEGRVEHICNLAAWCVLPTHRHHGLRLLRALLRQKGFHFTDLSPSGSVVPLNLRLGFRTLDTATALVPNVPLPGPSGVRIVSDPGGVAGALSGRDLELYRDHAGTRAARHLVIVRGHETCYVMFRRDRRKGLPLFASFIHVGNPTLFRDAARTVYGHLLLRHRIPLTLHELRVAGPRPRLSLMLRSPRPKMYRSASLDPDEVDYLYSELACVAW